MEKQKKLQNDLETKIKEAKNSYVDADIKVSVYDIESGISANVNGDKKGWAASIIKIPVMISVLQEVEKGYLNLDTKLQVNHNLMLEPYDYVSTLPKWANLKIIDLLKYMIVDSDNEATNILANSIGGPNRINKTMWDLGMNRSMLGHLLCPNVPRYIHFLRNSNGDNITTANDMVKIMRYIYDPSCNKLSKEIKFLSDKILSKTYPTYLYNKYFIGKKIKSKIGILSNPIDGADIHEVGIIDNKLIVSLMANKIGQESRRFEDKFRDMFIEDYFSPLSYSDKQLFNLHTSISKTGEVVKTYNKIIDVLGSYFGN